MKPKDIKLFSAGILIGAVLMGVIHNPFGLTMRENTASSSVVENNIETTTEDQKPYTDVSAEQGNSYERNTEGSNTKYYESNSETQGENNYSDIENIRPWDKTATYLSGDRVVYNGKIYRAKWWTLGEVPDKADVWEDTGVAAVSDKDKADSSQKNNYNTTGSTGNKGNIENPQVNKADTGNNSQANIYDKAGNKTAKNNNSQNNNPAKVTEGVKVVAYYPSWRSDQSKLRYDIVTHVVYAFAIPTADGDLRPLEAEEQVPELIKTAHNNKAKVLLGVGGWSYNDVPLESTFVSATSTTQSTTALADAIVNMCNAYGFDGVDIDWEHPRVDGSSAKQYESLMLILSEKLHNNGKLLTSAVLSGATPDGNIFYDAAAHSDKVLSAVDWINVMAYDGGDGERHSSYEFALNCGKYWRDTRKLPKEKVVLGVPFYSRPGWASYESILSSVPSAVSSDHVSYNGMEVWYNGPETIRKKAEFAARELGGIMIWEITQDTSDRQSSLLTAVGNGINKRQ